MLRVKEILSNMRTEDGKKATAVWLSDKINMAQPNVSNIINNKATPSIDTLQRIADALNVHISELFEQPSKDIINCPYCGGKIKIDKA